MHVTRGKVFQAQIHAILEQHKIYVKVDIHILDLEHVVIRLLQQVNVHLDGQNLEVIAKNNNALQINVVQLRILVHLLHALQAHVKVMLKIQGRHGLV
jgi:hypothetical protein